MAILSLELQAEGEGIPFSMERLGNESETREEHVIVIPRVIDGSTTVSHEDETNNYDSLNHLDTPSIAPLSTVPNHINVSVRRTGEDHSQHNRSPVNSGLWISIVFFLNLSQIVAAITILSLSRNEKPQTPLFTWVIGYTAGCIITLPRILWRYLHRNTQFAEQETTFDQLGSFNNPYRNANIRLIKLQKQKIVEIQEQEVGESTHWLITPKWPWIVSLLCGLWLEMSGFLVDNLQLLMLPICTGKWDFILLHLYSKCIILEVTNFVLFRLCIVFLAISCIGYAMPFVLFATLCCCLPCIICILGHRGDLNHTRGAVTEFINTLPTYNFKLKRVQKRGDHESLDGPGEGGILAAGTDRERMVSAEDAVCCICLSKYADNDVLRELPCSHFFHMECVDKWLKINALCPLCKSEIEEIT